MKHQLSQHSTPARALADAEQRVRCAAHQATVAKQKHQRLVSDLKQYESSVELHGKKQFAVVKAMLFPSHTPGEGDPIIPAFEWSGWRVIFDKTGATHDLVGQWVCGELELDLELLVEMKEALDSRRRPPGIRGITLNI